MNDKRAKREEGRRGETLTKRPRRISRGRNKLIDAHGMMWTRCASGAGVGIVPGYCHCYRQRRSKMARRMRKTPRRMRAEGNTEEDGWIRVVP